MPDIYEQIGKKIRELRGALSQDALAAKVGVASQYGVAVGDRHVQADP